MELKRSVHLTQGVQRNIFLQNSKQKQQGVANKVELHIILNTI